MNEALPEDYSPRKRVDLDVELRRSSIFAEVAGVSTDGSSPFGLDVVVSNAIDWLLEAQTSEGFWVGNVDTNSCIEAEWLLATYIIGTSLPDEGGVIGTLLQRQRPDGSWQTYVDAPDGDINSTIEVYAALRTRGFSPDCPELLRAREWILSHGGLSHVRVFTRYWLAMIGVWPWQATPNLPPEIIRFPAWFPFNIYNFAQWARATIVPLAIISARRPVWPLPGGSRLEELFPGGYRNFDFTASSEDTPFSLEWLFRKIDWILHVGQSAKLFPGRENSIKLCLEWAIRHQDADGAWGGIQPPWIYGLIALVNEGYALTHPVIQKGLSALSAHWSFVRDDGRHIQATESSVWDTLLTLLAMHEAGCKVSEMPEMQRAVSWILDQQVRSFRGDWSIKVKDVDPGAWAFERANLFYPDVDDTAVALLTLGKVRDSAGALRERIDEAIARGLAWTLAMQSSNGGWGAFDKDNDNELICKLPFCNFGEALDPPSVDVTAHVLEAFGALGLQLGHPSARRAVDFIRSEQEDDGSWFGRWGVNHIYGTGAVLPALRAIGEDMSQLYVRRAADWVVSKQNEDGGWGETCASYMDTSLRGVGPSTPSQTAWALMSLVAMENNEYMPLILRGIKYLCETQDGGTWEERLYTATGFPGYGVGARINLAASDLAEKLEQGTELSRGFMLNFNMYRHYFPLIALGRARSFLQQENTFETLF